MIRKTARRRALAGAGARLLSRPPLPHAAVHRDRRASSCATSKRARRDAGDPPWLAELAHYEWVELALQIAERRRLPPHDPDGDLLDGVPVLSPLAWPLAYRWPVHRIGPDSSPSAPPTRRPCCWCGAMPTATCASPSSVAAGVPAAAAARRRRRRRAAARSCRRWRAEAGATDIDAFIARRRGHAAAAARRRRAARARRAAPDG